jgi:hypothetical protein
MVWAVIISLGGSKSASQKLQKKYRMQPARGKVAYNEPVTQLT